MVIMTLTRRQFFAIGDSCTRTFLKGQKSVSLRYFRNQCAIFNLQIFLMSAKYCIPPTFGRFHRDFEFCSSRVSQGQKYALHWLLFPFHPSGHSMFEHAFSLLSRATQLSARLHLLAIFIYQANEKSFKSSRNRSR